MQQEAGQNSIHGSVEAVALQFVVKDICDRDAGAGERVTVAGLNGVRGVDYKNWQLVEFNGIRVVKCCWHELKHTSYVTIQI